MITSYKANLLYLQNQKNLLENKDLESNNYQEDIDRLNAQIAEMDKMIFLANQAQQDNALLEELSIKLQKEQEIQEKVNEYKAKLEKDKKLKEKRFIIEKNQSATKESEELEKTICELNEKLELTQKDYNIEQEKLSELEKERETADKIFNEAVSVFLQGVNVDDDSDIYQKLASYYTNYDKKAQELSQTLNALGEEYQILNEEIENTKQALKEAQYSASVKKAIRDGLVIEANLANKIAFLEQVNLDIENTNAQIASLKEQIENTKQDIQKAKDISIEKLGKDVSYSELYDRLNEDEKQKQTLYRNQIIIANAQREIEAIDNKIYQNEEAQRSYIEDEVALDKAKETLLGYIKKLLSKINSIDDKLILISAQKKYYDAIDKASFGDKCPVCNNAILHKSDFEKESKLIDKAYNDLTVEKQKAELVKKDYDLQLEKVNLRLGELTNRITTSRTYLESLKETKKAKYELVEKLLAQSGIKTFALLTDMLDAATKKVAITTNEFIEASKYHLVEKTFNDYIDNAAEKIKHLEEVVLKNALAIKEKTEKVIAKYNKELDLLSLELQNKTAEQKAMALTKMEGQEDELVKKLNKLFEKEHSLMEKITEVERELISIASRDDSIRVEKDGESLTYTQLFISLLKEDCSCRFDSLTTAQNEKQILQDRYIASLRLVANLEQEIADLSVEIAKAQAKKDALSEMIDTLNKNAEFNADTSDIQDGDTLSQEEQDTMLEYIKENEQTYDIIKTKISILKDNLQKNKDYLDDYDKNLTAKTALSAQLKESLDLLNASLSYKANYDYVAKEIENINLKLKTAEQKLSLIDAISKKDIDAIVNKNVDVNNVSVCQKVKAIIDFEQTLASLFDNPYQMLHRFIAFDLSCCQEDNLNDLKNVAQALNLSIIACK